MTSLPPSGSPEPDRPARRLLAAVFVLAWIPRLVLAVAYLHTPLGLDDMFQYDMLALSLARGDGYRWYQRAYFKQLEPYIRRYYDVDIPAEDVPETGYISVFRPPGYPAFLALVYRLSGESNRIAAARLIQTGVGAALAPLTVLLAAALGLPRKAGGLAGATVALYPILWMYPIGLASENLFLVLVASACLLILRAADDHRRRSAVLAGIVTGAAILTRGAFVFFLLLALPWFARRTGWRRCALFAATAAVVFIPWSIRNSLIAGRPAFVENSIGFNLYVGYHPQGDGGFVSAVARGPTRFLDDVERDRWSLEQALGFLRADPLRALALLPKRLAYLAAFESREMAFFYSNNVFGAIPTPLLAIGLAILVLPWLAVAGSAPFGMAASPYPAGRNLILLLVAATVLAYVPILAEPRFHLPLVPALAPYAAFLWTRWRPILGDASYRNERRLACAALAVLVCLWVWQAARLAPELQAVLAPGGNTLYLTY
jgi:4-amino-4-deoxy-L-arabinose transferase-like glycosyltransferase